MAACARCYVGRRSHIEEAALQGDRHGMGPVVRPQLGENAANVRFYSVFSDFETVEFPAATNSSTSISRGVR